MNADPPAKHLMMSGVEGKLSQLQRLLLCSRLYGFRTALKMVLRVGSTRSNRTLSLPGGLRFTFRGKQDFGVLTHFFSEGYRIQDSPGQPVTRIMDCGANIGDETARFFCHHPAAEILAIEAEPGNFALLRQNFGLIPRVKLIHGGVWSSDAYLKLIPPSDGNPEAFRVELADQAAGNLRAFSIPTLMEIAGWTAIDILKLDIEGAEHELFTQHSERWLPNVNVFIFEVPDQDRPGTTQEIFNRLAPFPLNTFVCGENLILVKRGLPWKAQRVLGIA